jgi:hypothetical protein
MYIWSSKILYAFLTFPMVATFDHPNIIRWRLQIMKPFVIVLFYPVFHYFLPLRSKYYSKYPECIFDGYKFNWIDLFQNPAICNPSESGISFSDTGLSSNIISVLEEQEITEPTVIQVCLLVETVAVLWETRIW